MYTIDLNESFETKWVTSFSRSMGITISAEAELWTLRDGLKLCNAKNIQVVEVESDAKVVVEMDDLATLHEHITFSSYI